MGVTRLYLNRKASRGASRGPMPGMVNRPASVTGTRPLSSVTTFLAALTKFLDLACGYLKSLQEAYECGIRTKGAGQEKAVCVCDWGLSSQAAWVVERGGDQDREGVGTRACIAEVRTVSIRNTIRGVARPTCPRNMFLIRI